MPMGCAERMMQDCLTKENKGSEMGRRGQGVRNWQSFPSNNWGSIKLILPVLQGFLHPGNDISSDQRKIGKVFGIYQHRKLYHNILKINL